MMLLVLAKVKF